MVTPDYEMQYHYDNVGRYDQIDRKVSVNWKKLAEYEYNGLGQRTEYTRYDNTGLNVVVHSAYEYLDDIGWLQKVTNYDAKPTGNVISEYKYYETNPVDKNDLVGNRKYMKYNSTDYIEYEYDDLYRLKTETRKPNGTQSAKYEYTYDLAGNRLTQSRYAGTGIWTGYHTYEYNDANQLTYERQYTNSGMGTDTKAIRYTYNDLGNLTDKDIETNDFPDDNYETFGYNDEEWDYGYDAYSRLINVDKDSNPIADYTFNVLGNRVMKEFGTETIKMLYDGYDCVADYDENTVLLRYYITPNLDENLLPQH